jgi:pectate lyase
VGGGGSPSAGGTANGGSGGSTPGCAVGLSQCGGSCVDTLTDAQNCGSCGTVCQTGEQCSNGSCTCIGGLTDCTGTCVELASSHENCGACGKVCAANEVCSQGTCGLDCADGLEQCGGSCVDTQTSEQYCGNCNTACSAAKSCEGGACECPDGLTACGDACANLDTDSQHCGSCGTTCGGGQSCSGGDCVCPNQQLFCNNQCKDGKTDASNCGTCGNVCASGVCSNGTCTQVSSGVIGWAATAGYGRATTTGGQGGSTVDVNSASALTSAASSSATQIIRISGTISVAELSVNSNKTLIGVGPNATINGGISISGKQNIIIQNLRINGRSSGADGDGIHIQNSHHVWVDHCDIWDSPDGNLDINDSSDNITVSWTRFYYSSNPPASDHRYSNLIGSGDDVTSDAGKLNVTFHHNWWAERVHERMPRVRFGKVHVFNNYFSSAGNNYCVRGGYQSNIRIENNYFEDVSNPHEIDGSGAVMTAAGNTYDGTSGSKDTSGTAFTPPYTYQLQAASGIPAAVKAGYGPR